MLKHLSRFGETTIVALAVFLAAPPAYPQVTVSDPIVDAATGGDNRIGGDGLASHGRFGNCFSVIAQGDPELQFPEIKIGPDFYVLNPDQYENVCTEAMVDPLGDHFDNEQNKCGEGSGAVAGQPIPGSNFAEAICITEKGEVALFPDSPQFFDFQAFKMDDVNVPPDDRAFSFTYKENTNLPPAGPVPLEGGQVLPWDLGNANNIFDTLSGPAQFNACRTEAGDNGFDPGTGDPIPVFRPSTIDNDRFVYDPLSGVVYIKAGGDATLSYYFLTAGNNCRKLHWYLYVSEDGDFTGLLPVKSSLDPAPPGVGPIGDFAGGKYLVFELKDIPDTGLYVQLDVEDDTSDDSDPIADSCAYNGRASDIQGLKRGKNSVISGVFVSGTDECSLTCGEVGLDYAITKTTWIRDLDGNLVSEVTDTVPSNTPLAWVFDIQNPNDVPIHFNLTDEGFIVTPGGDIPLGPNDVLDCDADFVAGKGFLLGAKGSDNDSTQCRLGLLTGEALFAEYRNVATLALDGAGGPTDCTAESGYRIRDPDPPDPNVEIVKLTNDQEANDPDGTDVPRIVPGDTVTWTYRVTNTGDVAVPFGDVEVTDNQTGVTPTFDSVQTENGDPAVFDPNDVWLYTASLPAENLLYPTPGVITQTDSCTALGDEPPRTAYTNIGTVTIPDASDTDPSSYCNPLPQVEIVKKTNGADANDPDGTDVPRIVPGDTVTWTYEVTNTGDVAVAFDDVNVTDNQTGVTPTFDSVLVENGDPAMFDPDDVWLYTASLPAENLLSPSPGVITEPDSCTADGAEPPRTAYTNIGTVTIPNASATDPSSYCNPLPQVEIIKRTNGADANDPDGTDVPRIVPGDTVTWTYEVTNTGDVAVAFDDVDVTDNQPGVTPAFDSVLVENGDPAIFDPDDVWLYTASLPAENLLSPSPGVITVPDSCTADGTEPPRTAYTNIGTVTIPNASATDPSSYCNPPRDPCIKVIKQVSVDGGDTWYPSDQVPDQPECPVTDGTDADPAACEFVYRFQVENCGNVDLDDVTLVDEKLLDAPMDIGVLTVGQVLDLPEIEAPGQCDRTDTAGEPMSSGEIEWSWWWRGFGNDNGNNNGTPPDGFEQCNVVEVSGCPDGVVCDEDPNTPNPPPVKDTDEVCVTCGEEDGGDGDEGCTPGYWKQEHHFFAWTNPPYSQDRPFDDVFQLCTGYPFEDDDGNSKTLLEMLWQGGGGKKALGRHAVAALLNAASNDVDSPWTEAELIQAVNEACNGERSVRRLKNQLDADNNLGCPLGNGGGQGGSSRWANWWR